MSSITTPPDVTRYYSRPSPPSSSYSSFTPNVKSKTINCGLLLKTILVVLILLSIPVVMYHFWNKELSILIGQFLLFSLTFILIPAISGLFSKKIWVQSLIGTSLYTLFTVIVFHVLKLGFDWKLLCYSFFFFLLVEVGGVFNKVKTFTIYNAFSKSKFPESYYKQGLLTIKNMVNITELIYLCLPVLFFLSCTFCIIANQTLFFVLKFSIVVVLIIFLLSLMFFLCCSFKVMINHSMNLRPTEFKSFEDIYNHSIYAFNLRQVHLFDSIHNVILVLVCGALALTLLGISIQWLHFMLIGGFLGIFFNNIPFYIGQKKLHKSLVSSFDQVQQKDIREELEKYSPIFPLPKYLQNVSTQSVFGFLIFEFIKTYVINYLLTQ